MYSGRLAVFVAVTAVTALLTGCPSDEKTGGADAADVEAPDADGGAGDVPADALPDTPVGDTEQDIPDGTTPDADADADAPIEAGPGLGVDYDSTPPGATPRFDPGSTDWLATGWPSDHYMTADGTVDLQRFPNPDDTDLLAAYKDYGTAHLDGWGLNGSVYLQAGGVLDLNTLPGPDESRAATSPVQLVNVTPGSPAYGQRSPLVFAFYGEGTDAYWPENTLAMRPVFGAPLREGETYCAVLSRAVQDADGNYLSPAPAFVDALGSDPVLAPLVGWLPDSQFAVEDLATATCFTTQLATKELLAVSQWLDTQDPPGIDTVFEPLVWGEFHGTYTAPNFQSGDKPYADEGGDLLFDANGDPIVQEDEELRFLLLTPRDQPMPAAGWPVVLYAHGTGGSYESCRGRADELNALGYALLCIDQPLHGPRGPYALDDSELILYSFNFFNPGAGRTSFRQSAIDTMVLSRMAIAGSFDLDATETAEKLPVQLDPTRVYFFGHSHGGLSGALLFGVDPTIGGGVLSGTGGVLIETVLRRKDPVDLRILVAAALGIAPADLDSFHPAMSLMQQLVDATDPVNYSRYWLDPAQGGVAKHVLVTEGTADHATPAVAGDAMAAAGHIPQIGQVAKLSQPHQLAGLEPQPLPVSVNAGPAGAMRTAGLKQWQGENHWVALYNPEAIAIWKTFFKTVLLDPDAPVLGVGTEGGDIVETAVVAPGESCLEAGSIDMAKLPVTVMGDTSLATDDHTNYDSCNAGLIGEGRRDLVWKLDPVETGDYTFRLRLPAPEDPDVPRPGPNAMYLLQDCEQAGDWAGAWSCVDLQLGHSTMTSLMNEGTTYYLVVDGQGVGDVGTFYVDIGIDCQSLACGDRECGQWGCNSCGTCGAGEVCTDEGQCVATGTGDTCQSALAVVGLPYVHAGTTNGFANDYGYTVGQCEGFTGGYGKGSADVAFAWTVPSAGTYTLELEADYDANLYVVTDCADVDGTCVAADRSFSGGERIVKDFAAGEALYVIVDGAANTIDRKGNYTLRIDACQPDCNGKACGPDGCGGSCGTCPAGERCLPETTCEPLPVVCETTATCEAIAKGDTCDDPYIADTVPYSHTASTKDFFDEYLFLPAACPGYNGGHGGGSNDAVYQFTAPSDALYHFKLSPEFDSALWLATDCGNMPESCVGAHQVNDAKKAERVYYPMTAGESVFVVVDGRSNSSNDAGKYTLSIDTCTPSCDGKECGSDGCGGSCGGCASPLVCWSGTCDYPKGNTCQQPIVVDNKKLPWSHDGNTEVMDNNYADTCLGDPQVGDANPDMVYRFTAPSDGEYQFHLQVVLWNAGFYIVEDCADTGDSCLESNNTQIPYDRVYLNMTAGQTVYMIVDSTLPAPQVSTGPFTVTVSKTCEPDCDGKECGADGCGGSCGECAAPTDLCDESTCVDPTSYVGNTCAMPHVVDALPFAGSGDTSLQLHHYATGDGFCPGFVAKGAGSKDEVWQLTPETTGVHQITIVGASFDASVLVTTDCQSLATSCVGMADGHVVDVLDVMLEAGTPYYVIVDGADNVVNEAGPYQILISGP